MMHVYSGVCRLCDVGIPSGMLCFKTEEELFTGDIVLLYSVEYAGTDYEFWNCHGMTVIVADQYTTYNGGDIIEANPVPFKPFCMGVKSVDFPSDKWKLQRIKSFADVIDGEHWPEYGFNYKEDGEQVMMYNIIKQLQETSSTNDKLAILKANKDNEEFKEYMRLVSCPSVNFYITAKTFPKAQKVGKHTFASLREAGYTLGTKELSERAVTGQAAKNFISQTLNDLDEQHQELYKMLLLKDIRAKVGKTLVNKVWDKLCVDVPYQRCSLITDKNLLPFMKGEQFIVQTKGDGQFASLVFEETKRTIYTRNGNTYPSWFAQYIAEGLDESDVVYEGELICFRGNEMLSRKEGNGILNSVMQEGEMPENINVKYFVWNRVPLEEWKAGKATQTYDDAFFGLVWYLDKKKKEPYSTYQHRVIPINWKVVRTMEEAYAFNNEQLAKGLEGSIIKTLTHKWKDGTSKECLKLKVEAEIDLIWTDSVEGKGKAAGMLGAMCLQSSCGRVKVDCGTGYTDSQRKQLWEDREKLHGSVVTVKANDLVSKEGSEVLSLFLPVFIEVREKQEADSLERIEQIFKSAKNMLDTTEAKH